MPRPRKTAARQVGGRRLALPLVLLLVLLSPFGAAPAAPAQTPSPGRSTPPLLARPGAPTASAAGQIHWYEQDADGNVTVLLYFFFSPTCGYCRAAKPHIAALAQTRPWLRVVALDVLSSQGNRDLYVSMAQALGHKPGGVPLFMLCGRAVEGWDGPQGVGAYLGALADFCHLSLEQQRPVGQAVPPPAGASPTVQLPWGGELSAAAFSLPMLTLVLGGLDAFNPCAFFVLLFLLSLLVHTRSRGRMLAVGGVFVVFSGLVYFAFMAAWLNLFLVAGGLAWITAAAGAVALLIGLLNVKDYLWFQRGPTLSIPAWAKPGLFARMRGLLSAERPLLLLGGAAVLALTANAYELLCTSGFPMVFTRVLTLRELPTPAYYGYLAAYNAVYVVPLLVIVLAFTATLGRRTLSEVEGRVLKLASGLMMAGLGALLLAAPEAMSNPLAAGGLLLLAVASAALALLWERHRRPRTPAGG